MSEELRHHPTRKIFFVINEFEFFVSHRSKLAKRTAEDGFEVTVLTHNVKTSRCCSNSFNLIELNSRYSRKFSNALSDIFILRMHFKREGDITVNAVGTKMIILVYFASLFLAHVNIVNTISGLGFLYSKRINNLYQTIRFFHSKLLRFVLTRPKAINIFQNNNDLNTIIGCQFNKDCNYVIKGSGVEPKEYRLKNGRRVGGKIQLCYAARLLWTKGPGDFFNLCNALMHEQNSFVANIYGKHEESHPDGVPLDTLNKWNKSTFFNWHGFSQDLPTVLGNFDIFVYPSIYGEGVPKVLIEAAAAGLPIICYDMPGCRDIVIHNINGLLVNPGDENGLLRATKFLISNPVMRKKMGAAGIKIVEKSFSINTINNKIIEVLSNAKVEQFKV